MNQDGISVISLHEISSNEESEEIQDTKGHIQCENDSSRWNILHGFSVLAVCIVFASPITLIPRTNSIFYQTYWFEVNVVIGGLLLLRVGSHILNMATFFEEKSLKSFWILLRLYLLDMTLWMAPYLIVYVIWCSYLGYNWPIPYLAYNWMVSDIGFIAGMWFVLPQDLRSKIEFKRNLKWYILYIVVSTMLSLLKEGISILFKILPPHLQWIVAFLIPLLQHFDMWSRSKWLNRMTGGQSEESGVLMEILVNASYSFFVAVRLPDAETITICFFIAVNMVLRLRMTYQIYQLHYKVTDELIRNGELRKRKMIRTLVLAELTYDLSPLIYGIVFAMAYYGPNRTILDNVKHAENVGDIFRIMALLFGIDILSMIANSLILSTLTNVRLYHELCRVMKKYWTFMAIKFAQNSSVYFASKDINLGIDSSGEWVWITQEGRLQLINNSTDLLEDEKSILLSQDF